MNAKQKKCWTYGHDWAYSFENAKGGWIHAKCLRCDAHQFFFCDEVEYEPNVDDDGTKEQNE